MKNGTLRFFSSPINKFIGDEKRFDITCEKK